MDPDYLYVNLIIDVYLNKNLSNSSTLNQDIINAINAYITEGRVPQDYVDYAKKDADGIVREDLLLSMSERLNHVTDVMEKAGLVILKDENGKYLIIWSPKDDNYHETPRYKKQLFAFKYQQRKEQELLQMLNFRGYTEYLNIYKFNLSCRSGKIPRLSRWPSDLRKPARVERFPANAGKAAPESPPESSAATIPRP